MVTQANDRSKAIINVANEYTDDALRRTEEAIQQALEGKSLYFAPLSTTSCSSIRYAGENCKNRQV